MAYPTDTGQSYTTINGTDNTGATLGDGLTHSGRHNAVENEVTALKEKVGINGDSDNSTLDFKTSEITGGDTAVGKSATQTLTNKTLTSPTISLWDGWDERTVGDYSYASTTTINTTSDKTGEIQVGDKIKIVTAGGTFYFFVTAITSSLITVYGGTDYTVPNATFTQFAVSRVKAPFGFPINPDKWTEKWVSSSSDIVTTSSTLVSLASITLEPGIYLLRYSGTGGVDSVTSGQEDVDAELGLSTSSSSISIMETYKLLRSNPSGSTNNDYFGLISIETIVSPTTTTTYHLTGRVRNANSRLFAGFGFIGAGANVLSARLLYL